MIKAVQINSGDLMGRRFNGFDLKPYLEQRGVSVSQLVYWNKESEAEFVSKVFDYPGSRHLTRAMTKLEYHLSLHARLHPHSWTLPFHKKVHEADIQHFHIIHDGYFSLSALPYLTRNKPTVWTWHDPWPMTGHCIYPVECEKWQMGCGGCPNLMSPFPMKRDRTAEQYAWKKRLYKNTKAEIVVASRWMLDMVSKSPLAEFFNFNLIPFGLDLERYSPRDKTAARNRLGIYPGFPVVFLRSSSTPFKGLSEFISALSQIDPDLRLCIISLQETGHFDQFIGKHQIIEFGWSNDEELLLDAYAACDFFAMPSRAEAFGLMAIEAMACGRPVVCFDGTSLPEITYAQEAGVSVPNGNTEALARVIERLARSPAECEIRGHRSREIAELNYDIRQQARLTSELYKRTIEQNN